VWNDFQETIFVDFRFASMFCQGHLCMIRFKYVNSFGDNNAVCVSIIAYDKQKYGSYFPIFLISNFFSLKWALKKSFWIVIHSKIYPSTFILIIRCLNLISLKITLYIMLINTLLQNDPLFVSSLLFLSEKNKMLNWDCCLCTFNKRNSKFIIYFVMWLKKFYNQKCSILSNFTVKILRCEVCGFVMKILNWKEAASVV